MIKEEYDALPDEAHESRLRWIGGRFNYKPILLGNTRMIPHGQDEGWT